VFQLTKRPLCSSSQNDLCLAHKMTPCSSIQNDRCVSAYKMALFQLIKSPLFQLFTKWRLVPITKWLSCFSSQNGLLVSAHKMTSLQYSCSQKALCILARKKPSVLAHKRPLCSQKALYSSSKIASVQRFPLLISFRLNTKRKSLNTGRERTDLLCTSHVL
jgi:hypothetical protein